MRIKLFLNFKLFFRFIMKLIFFFLFCTFSGGLSEPNRLINIDYIGRGYDIYYGNPQTEQADPGFREAVVKITYDYVRLSECFY
jgi:hypothetical protein